MSVRAQQVDSVIFGIQNSDKIHGQVTSCMQFESVEDDSEILDKNTTFTF